MSRRITRKRIARISLGCDNHLGIPYGRGDAHRAVHGTTYGFDYRGLQLACTRKLHPVFFTGALTHEALQIASMYIRNFQRNVSCYRTVHVIDVVNFFLF